MACNLKRERNGYTGACPSCGYPSGFTVSEKGNHVLLYCHAGGCTYKEIVSTLQAKALWGYSTPQTPRVRCESGKTAKTQAVAQTLWAQSQSAQGTLVESYLRCRGITCPIPDSIRFLPHAKHAPTGQYAPVMLAKVTHWKGAPLVAVHRTYLKPDGTGKLDHAQAKMILGPVQGCAVHFAPAGERLAIAEGLETGLSVWQSTCIPTWAALSCGGIQGLVLPPLPLALDVVICADHDPPGLNAAYKAAEQWTLQGRRVKVVKPPQAGQDFNDMLRQGGQLWQ